MCVYNKHDIAKLFSWTQIPELRNNRKEKEYGIGKEIICTIYGSYVLTAITSLSSDIEMDKFPDFINDN